ncbi:phage tail protein [Listeria monocytogenes]|nr:phage tail protein [Listeria monocytogenes]
MFGITFLDKHSFRDYGLICKEKSIGFPDKEKIEESVPFSNEVYDFSTLYGTQTYKERKISYTFYVYDDLASTVEVMTAKKIRAANWLMNSNRTKLIDDDIEGYYFLAEAINIDFPEQGIVGQLKVEFTAYPFKTRVEEEGSDAWDAFNFESDIAQNVSYLIDRTENIKIFNAGTNDSKVLVNASSMMEIKTNNKIFKVPRGESESDDFFFVPGENDLVVTGNGTIDFHFHREVL